MSASVASFFSRILGHEGEDDPAITTAKWVSLSLLAAISLTVGFVPMFFREKLTRAATPKVKLLLSLLLCFGGGVLFAACFLHILPEVIHGLSENMEHGEIEESHLPIAELVMCAGFFLIYLVEETVRAVFGDLGHGHSHKNDEIEMKAAGEVAEDAEESGASINKLRSFLLVLALSFHALMEGIAIGLQDTEDEVWLLFTAIASHKFVIMFCMTMELTVIKTNKIVHIIYVVMFGITSSLGAIIGIGVSENLDTEGPVVNILQGMAAGTLLYVSFFEIINRERSKPGHGLMKFAAILVGFLVLFGVDNIHHHEHHHHHDR